MSQNYKRDVEALRGEIRSLKSNQSELVKKVEALQHAQNEDTRRRGSGRVIIPKAVSVSMIKF